MRRAFTTPVYLRKSERRGSSPPSLTQNRGGEQCFCDVVKPGVRGRVRLEGILPLLLNRTSGARRL
jgi:hypothetical protein